MMKMNYSIIKIYNIDGYVYESHMTGDQYAPW